MQADTPEPVYGMPITSSSSWTVPSSPSRPCSATNATSGASALQLLDEVGADVDRDHLVAERSSASWTRAPDAARPAARASARP